MIQFFVGVIVGVAAATIGFTGMAQLADKGVQETQKVLKDSVKEIKKE